MTIRRFLGLLMQHVRNFFTNWREYDAPFATKLRLTLRNRGKAMFLRAQCCGHAGEPGC